MMPLNRAVSLLVRRAPSALLLSRTTLATRVCANQFLASYATAAKKTTAAKKAPTKKPAVKKAVAKKTPAAKKKTAAAKKKPAAKPKKRAVKAKAKKPVVRKKKPLTEEQKEALKIKELKALALPKPPSPRPMSAYTLYMGKITKGSHSLANFTSDASAQFKALPVAEREALDREVAALNIERKANYQKWVEQYTPSQIRKANLARQNLKRRNVTRVDTTPIKDIRAPSRPTNAYGLFMAQSGIGGGKQAFVELAARWKALTPAEKKVYEDLAATAHTKYEAEKARIFA